MNDRPYIGRFAPTPSGPLHFGSIIAALASFLDARSQNGLWLLRIDDLDTPRVAAGSIDSILRALERLGLHWDKTPTYQSNHIDYYQSALDVLKNKDLTFSCDCPRKLVKGGPYSGTCRNKDINSDKRHSIRIKTTPDKIIFIDLIQKQQIFDLNKLTGDFIVKRSDGLFAYHLAVVVSDYLENINNVVRGADLLDATPNHIYLQNCLEYPTPIYSHLPVAMNASGHKLSKQHGTKEALLNHSPKMLIIESMKFLNMDPLPELDTASIEEILEWGVTNWSLKNINNKKEIVAQIE